LPPFPCDAGPLPLLFAAGSPALLLFPIGPLQCRNTIAPRARAPFCRRVCVFRRRPVRPPPAACTPQPHLRACTMLRVRGPRFRVAPPGAAAAAATTHR
jgi:hypothetical protein